MKESQFISVLFIASPDYQPIILNIRGKYDIPEISPGDDGITEVLLADEQIDWDACIKKHTLGSLFFTKTWLQ